MASNSQHRKGTASEPAVRSDDGLAICVCGCFELDHSFDKACLRCACPVFRVDLESERAYEASFGDQLRVMLAE